MNKDTKYLIKANKEQVYLIKSALEVMSRLLSGQIAIALEEAYTTMINRESLEFIEEEVKKNVFPELGKNAYYGVGSKESGDLSSYYDMLQVLRHKLSWDRVKEENKDKPEHLSVDHQPPIKMGKLDLIEVYNEQ